MPTLTINNRTVEVAEGTTLLHAVKDLGIEVPTLCYWEGVKPMNSCMLCVMRNVKTGLLVPSCSTVVQEGMEIETDSGDVCAARKDTLDLIVSEHLGDCEAPCTHTCPASMNIPTMMRQIYTGDLDGAAYTVTNGLVFPWTLGYICPAPCQSPCRRKSVDETMEIRELHKTVAPKAMEENPEILECPPDTGKRVAVVGAGLCGMSAAWVTRKCGHACTVYEKDAVAGGRWRDVSEEDLPKEVLDKEMAWIARLGIDIRYETPIDAEALEALASEYDAVIVACASLGKPSGCIFEAKEHKLAVRAVGNGKICAKLVDRYVRSIQEKDVTLFQSKAGRMEKSELETMRILNQNDISYKPEVEQKSFATIQAEAGRCIHCDCRKRHSCNLRKWSTEYGADTRKYNTTEEIHYQLLGKDGSVIFEPGKCIRCGLCIEIAKKYDEHIGLTFIGRGFEMEVKVPFGGEFDEGLTKSAEECIAACPTAAIAWRNKEDLAGCHTTDPAADPFAVLH